MRSAGEENGGRQGAARVVSAQHAFRSIHRGDRIFVSTGCGEPRRLIEELVRYVESNPGEIFDAEVLHLWTLGVAPYPRREYRPNFRHNSFFVGDHTREAVNSGLADYTPIFLSRVPEQFRRGFVTLDVALIQASPPDAHGYMSLGVSVDIALAATQAARTVIAQANPQMPRAHGSGVIHVRDVDYIVEYDEPILEYAQDANTELAAEIGRNVSRLVRDGATIQVGYGSIPNAVCANLTDKRDLGVHTELLSDGLVQLIQSGAVTNARKTVDPGLTVASFSMGTRPTYDFIDDNPGVQLQPIDYTNDPLVIARQDNMTAINSALEIDLTGQASAESIGALFYSGIGGQADFMRGAVLARNGVTILALPSTAEDGSVSRITPALSEGAGVTLNRGDTRYVVTEHGIAYLHGKNVRERAMELIGIADPKFQPWLIEEAKRRNLIYSDQAFVPGKRGHYPQDMEAWRTTRSGSQVFLRPVKISDEPVLKDFFYSLSDRSLYRRFISARADVPHERLQQFAVIDYTREMVLLAVESEEDRAPVLGVGQYGIEETTRTAEIAVVVRDDMQRTGIGAELVAYLTLLAKRQGLLGFTAEVLVDNRPMLALFEGMGFDIQRRADAGVYELRMTFPGD
ncbi:GNAT family N-acetyltransferase [Candidatus Poribacteria bacterium]|nr:GNAT family N-acetyltransferase [Candidatus Poribacteria bacterium]